MRALPYVRKEVRRVVSQHTPWFCALPSSVQIFRTAPCDAHCIMCSQGFLKGEALRRNSAIVFTDDEVTQSIEQIYELCGRGTVISYIAGEPTLARPLLRWIRRASELGMDFRFTTHGYRIDRSFAEALVTAGLFNVGVSLESLDPAVNERLRPYPRGTQRTIEAIEWLLSERQRQQSSVSINIKTVLTALNPRLARHRTPLGSHSRSLLHAAAVRDLG